MPSVAILLAGGSGSRMRGVVQDKILEPILGVPGLIYSVRAFLASGVADRFVIVRRDDAQRDAILSALAEHFKAEAAPRRFQADDGRIETSDTPGEPTPRESGEAPLLPQIIWAVGGAERRDSVLSGLEAAPAGTELAFIHDSARPLVRPESLRKLAAVARRDGGAVLAHKVKDTIKQVPKGAVAGTPVAQRDLDRSTLWAMETPQAFRHALILEAYRRVVADGATITDDVAAATHAGHKVTLVENLFPNPKITEPSDLAWVEFLLKK